ncbi:MAG TPA: hypothetical protein VLJ14_11755 [Ktedonobacterales bacterium]|nr:hypothetical protein [Ktedonobacterales bacterium]
MTLLIEVSYPIKGSVASTGSPGWRAYAMDNLITRPPTARLNYLARPARSFYAMRSAA